MKEEILSEWRSEWSSMNSELNRERDLESRGTINFHGVEIEVGETKERILELEEKSDPIHGEKLLI